MKDKNSKNAEIQRQFYLETNVKAGNSAMKVGGRLASKVSFVRWYSNKRKQEYWSTYVSEKIALNWLQENVLLICSK